jgi:hypothetical protein
MLLIFQGDGDQLTFSVEIDPLRWQDFYLFLKNLNGLSVRNFGCSSGIQCPESGITVPLTFSPSGFIESNTGLPGTLPPKTS